MTVSPKNPTISQKICKKLTSTGTHTEAQLLLLLLEKHESQEIKGNGKESLKNLSYKKKQDKTANITKKKTKRKRKEEKKKNRYCLESVGQFVTTMPLEHTAKATTKFYYKPLTARTSASVPCIKLIEPYQTQIQRYPLFFVWWPVCLLLLG